MTITLLGELAWKSALVAGLALLLIAALGRRSAAEKSLVAHLGVLALVLLPAFVLLLPSLAIETPGPLAAAAERVPALLPATNAAPPTVAVSAAAAPDWSGAITGAYLVGALLLLGGLAAALIRLWQIRTRAELLDQPGWLTALVAAQRRVGCKTGTALLVSNELDSPVSWGFLRPTIIVDSSASQSVDKAEAIIAHELAHVVRLDWLRLILGRVAAAFFWFNPLVWVLVRRSHQLAEEAADDSVLRTHIPRSDYAELLLHSVRHAQRSALLAANGVAPSRSSLSQRVDHVLDSNRPRQAVRFGWGIAGLALALSLNGVLAAATPYRGNAALPTIANAGEQAAAALENLQSPQARAIGTAIRLRSWDGRRVGEASTFNDPAAVAPLVAALRDDDADVRAIALWGLSEMRPPLSPATGQQVAPLLRDRSPLVRAQAARMLAEIDSLEHAAAISALLGDPVPDVRTAAAHALGDLQLPQSRAALEAARDDPDAAVRAKVAWAIRQVDDAESVLRRLSG